MITEVTIDDIAPELVVSTARSSGPGGQNVNKVNSKVTLRFDIANSVILSDEVKALLLRKLASRLTSSGVLLVTAQEKRSQFENRLLAAEKLSDLLKRAFLQPKRRKATRPTSAAKRKRLDSKKLQGEKKKWRQRPL